MPDSRSPAGRPVGLSVVIPSYGRPDLLLRAVNSVRSRSPDRVEIIVVDDASPEPLAEKLTATNESGIIVRVFRLHRNGGPQTARNLGIRRASFSHIAFLDSDDMFHEDKMDRLVMLIDGEGFDLLFHAVDGMPREQRIAQFWQTRLRLVLPFFWLLSFFNFVPTPSLVIRRRVRLGVPGARHCEDYGFLLRYGTPFDRVLYLDERLAEVGRRQGEVGGLSAQRWQMRKGEFQARRILLRKGSLSDALRWMIGSAMGSLRILSDIVRGRYVR